VPRGLSLAFGRVVGWLWYYVVPVRRHVARVNVHRAFGQSESAKRQRRIVREAFVHQTWMGIEALRLAHHSAATLKAEVRFEGTEHFDKARAKGKGVILVVAHLGSFVQCIGAAIFAGFVQAVIFRKLDAGVTRSFELQLFDHCGAEPVPSRGSKELVRAVLARGQGLMMAIDQHLAPYRSVVCSFFGQLAATTPAPARFSLETGAPIVPMRFRRGPTPERHVISFEPEFVLEAPHADAVANLVHNTDRLNHVIERWILDAPEQWLWMHKRWKVHDHPEGWQIPEQFLGLKRNQK